ncbi:hypothetical protein NEOLEDRAFT_1240088 [Neolentinus lepideus HHB14362 ss-1]|uniref:Zn(2)-C6 fungal-type domain-containing protein n=1 Tax=Neolentinus lepideus HHB14362 ss-1 TaxID=1314782 RepID=A0A165U1L1_9AGAM|nr:hypothetical protein NEOLEDRAFT_1240088 [Neolentinus lepideus HHB14362 ss-1]
METRAEDLGGAQFILEPSGRVRKQKGTRQRPGRVPMSCAECRRLKVRCDRKAPCGGCIKRGCASICPDGSLVVDKNNRLVLSNTEELHDEIDNLRLHLLEVKEELRIAKEAASADSSSGRSSNRSSPQTDSGCPSDNGSPACTSAESSSHSGLGVESQSVEDENFIDAFGSLTIGPRGETKFFGKTARSEFLILANTRRPFQNIHFHGLSQRILDASTSVPQCYRRSIASEESIRRELHQALPTLSEACRLCEIFLEHGKYMYYPLQRSVVFNEIIPNVYRSGLPTLDAIDYVSLLFIIFAYATYADPSLQAYHPLADNYYIYSRVALNSMPSLTETTVIWVQAYAYQSQFVELRDCEGTSMAWIDISNAFKFGQSIGLHLKSSRWHLDDKTSRQRTYLFWQLFFGDAWLSFSYGRPPSIDLQYIECGMPTTGEEEQSTDEDGNKHPGYIEVMIGFAIMLRTVIMPTAFAARMPLYTDILDLDRRLRELYVPVSLRPFCVELDHQSPMYIYMQRWKILSYRETTLLHLHRGYFAQAIQDNPEDPLKHKYGLSVIAAYRSAYRLIKYMSELYSKDPFPMERMSLAWSHALTASIVMCLLVTRSRPSKISRYALKSLDVAHSLFECAAETSHAAAHSLDIVRKLHGLAHSALDDMPSRTGSPVLAVSELERLHGKTTLTNHPESLAADPTAVLYPSASSSMPEDNQFFASLPENVHPTIMNDMMAFEGSVPVLQALMFDVPPEPASVPQEAYTGGWDFGGVNWNQYGAQQVPSMGSQEQPLMLDSTWQSFVEQLRIQQF